MEEKEKRSPARWDPFSEIEAFGRWPFAGRPSRLLEEMWGPARGYAPAVDVNEDDDHYTVTAELPGVKKNDITVELQEGMLTIRGEKRSEREEKGKHRRHVERSYGSFSRSFTMPPNADADHIKASFADGVLTVEIRKTQEPKPRTVDIKD